MRPALLLALTLSGCQAGPPAYLVDQVEEGRALLVDEAGAAHSVDAATLPPDAGEGAWLVNGRRDRERERAYRERLRQQRRALSHADDGRDLAL